MRRRDKLQNQLDVGRQKYSFTGKEGVAFAQRDHQVHVHERWRDWDRGGSMRGHWWWVYVGKLQDRNTLLGWVEGTEKAAIARAREVWPGHVGNMQLVESDKTYGNKPITRWVAGRFSLSAKF